MMLRGNEVRESKARSASMADVRDDKYWIDAAAFVKEAGCEPQGVIAPREFEQLVPGIVAYEDRAHCAAPKIVVMHKGLLTDLGPTWIEGMAKALHPAFGNEVFVIFSATGPVHRVGHPSHFAAFGHQLRKLHSPTVAEPRGDGPAVTEHQRRPSIWSRLPRWAGRRRAAQAHSSPRTTIYVGSGRALTRTIHGHKMYVDTRDFGFAPHLLLDGYWEPHITNVFRQSVRPGMTVVEVGANVGYYSVLAADLIGHRGRLFAFEANPGLAELCFRNLHINGFTDRATVIGKAVYSRSDRLTFKASERYPGGSSLYATVETAAALRDRLREIEVEAVSLDEYFEIGQRLDFLKIDAEGAEPDVLRGARRLLTENADIVVMLEYYPEILEWAHGSVQAFWDEVRALGFKVFEIKKDGSLLASPFELSLQDCDLVLRRQ